MEDETEKIEIEEITPNEQTTEKTAETAIELSYATLDALTELSIDIDRRIAEIRDYIDGRLTEYSARNEGSITNGTNPENQTIIQEEDTRPNERHFWFRRIRD